MERSGQGCGPGSIVAEPTSAMAVAVGFQRGASHAPSDYLGPTRQWDAFISAEWDRPQRDDYGGHVRRRTLLSSRRGWLRNRRSVRCASVVPDGGARTTRNEADAREAFGRSARHRANRAAHTILRCRA